MQFHIWLLRVEISLLISGDRDLEDPMAKNVSSSYMRQCKLPIWASIFLFACSTPAVAPAATHQEPVKFNASEAARHLLNPPDWMAVPADAETEPSHFVEFELVVGLDGRTESISVTRGDLAYAAEAKRSLGDPVLKPFTENGIPVRAKIELRGVAVESIEPSKPVPFPEVIDRRTISISLTRGSCYGRCASYSVELRGDGSAVFNGQSFVSVTGEQTGRVSEQKFDKLLAMLRSMNFYSLPDRYAQQVTDSPTYSVTVSIDGNVKKVVDHMGINIGMPGSITDLENLIDLAGDTPKWVSGTSYDVQTLRQQGFDFKSMKASQILADLAWTTDVATVWEFEKAGATFRDDENAWGVLSAVSGHGKLEMVKYLLGRGVGSANRQAKTDALYQAAERGHLDVAKALIASGADPTGKDKRSHLPVIFAASRSGDPELVEALLRFHPDLTPITYGSTSARSYDQSPVMEAVSDVTWEKKSGANVARIIKDLGAAGADMNVEWIYGTALQIAKDPLVERALLDCGANPNMQDAQGRTPLDDVVNEEMAILLIERGADFNRPSPEGILIAERAKASHWHRVLDLLATKTGLKN